MKDDLWWIGERHQSSAPEDFRVRTLGQDTERRKLWIGERQLVIIKEHRTAVASNGSSIERQLIDHHRLIVLLGLGGWMGKCT